MTFDTNCVNCSGFLTRFPHLPMFKLLLFLLWAGTLLRADTSLVAELIGHKLLTTSIRTGDTEVFVIDPATGDAFNVTKAPKSEERYPLWLPDGRRVVFTSNREDGRTFNLYLANADGSGLRQLTHQTGGAVYYFPSVQADGRRIWFSLAQGDKAVIGYVTPDGREYREVAEGRDGAISPDGKTIAFTRKTGKGFPVFAMDADGRNVRQLTQHENEIGAVAPTWSPDGKRILYADQAGEALEVFVCDADGRNVRQLSQLGKISSSAAWSPDGRFITFRVTDMAYWRNDRTREKAYDDKQADKRPVWVMRADGTDAQLLEVLHYHCAIDGSRAAFRPR
jgi:TolB protein